MTTNFKKNEFSFLKTVLSPLLGQLYMYSDVFGLGGERSGAEDGYVLYNVYVAYRDNGGRLC